MNISFVLKKIDKHNSICKICSEKLGFSVCAFVFVSENLLPARFWYCCDKDKMNTDERFAEMALAIQQLAHTVARLEVNQQERVIPVHNHERNTED